MKICKFLFKINMIVCSCLLSQYVYASGYQLFEQDASGLGESYASGAVAGDSAAIEYNNPAAMILIDKPSLAVSTVLVYASTRFNIDSSVAAGHQVSGSATENPLGTNLIPTVHYVHPINNKLVFGFGITEPFGLETNYDPNGMARYFATKSKIVTINYNPSLAYAVTDDFSIGGGVSVQYISANLDARVPTENAAADIVAENTASSWGYGFNFGLMYKFAPSTVMGLSYRSSIHQKPSGKFKFTYPSDTAIGGTVDTDINLPETYMLSLRHAFNEQWATAATVSYTYWSRFNYLRLTYDNTYSQKVVHENFHNSLRYALGADYRLNKQWLFRVGTAYDNSPVGDQDRNIALPDADRFWLSCGANYAFNPDVSLDAGYAHLFLKSGAVQESSAIIAGALTGHYNRSYANLLGLQLNWKFG